MCDSRLFIFTSTTPWGNHSDMQHMAQHMAKRHAVVYVNPPYDAPGLLGGTRRGNDRALQRASAGMWVLDLPIIAVSPGTVRSAAIFDEMNLRNYTEYAGAIRWAVHYLGAGDFSLVCDNPMQSVLMFNRMLTPGVSLYFRQRGEEKRLAGHARRLLPTMARKCDMVVAQDEWLAEFSRTYNENSYHIGRPGDTDPCGQTLTWDDCAERLCTLVEFSGAKPGYLRDGPADRRKSVFS